MIRCTDDYGYEKLREMDDIDMANLLKYYKSNKVPRFECLKAMRGEYDAFDGSFGFCVGWG
jgi:precorrin-2 dehydrogenase/sirohydrochlorin ferrochelatase